MKKSRTAMPEHTRSGNRDGNKTALTVLSKGLLAIFRTITPGL
jgi:hypothetical protein